MLKYTVGIILLAITALGLLLSGKGFMAFIKNIKKVGIKIYATKFASKEGRDVVKRLYRVATKRLLLLFVWSFFWMDSWGE